MRRLPPLSAVRVFEAAARLGNFTRAAEELGMTQAAVSYQVKLLEERLGTPLFQRKGRRVELTETGQRIAPGVTGAFDDLDLAFAAARDDRDSLLTISCSATFATNWLAARLGRFQMAHPGLAVRLLVSDTIVDLNGEADVAIRNSAKPWPGLVNHFLMRVPFAPLASPAYLDAQPPITKPDDVIGRTLLSPDDRWWPRWYKVATGSDPAVTERGIGLRLESQILDGNAAIAGQGIAILNVMMWRPQLRSGALVQPLPQVAYSSGRYRLVYPESRRLLTKIRAFREWLLEEIARDAAEEPHEAFEDVDV